MGLPAWCGSLAPWRNPDGSEPWKSLSNGISFRLTPGEPLGEFSTPVENPVEIRAVCPQYAQQAPVLSETCGEGETFVFLAELRPFSGESRAHDRHRLERRSAPDRDKSQPARLCDLVRAHLPALRRRGDDSRAGGRSDGGRLGEAALQRGTRRSLG